MAIEEDKHGNISITGAADINFVRLLSIRSALRLETKGLRNSRGSVMPILANMGFAPVKSRYMQKDREATLKQLSDFIESSIQKRKDGENDSE